MRFERLLLKLAGWKVDITVPRRDKCVICVAPHTSNWDFIIGLLAYRSLGRKANFLMKKFWFFFPLKYIMKALGGIPVGEKKQGSLTECIIEKFKASDYVNLAVTPEGTRSRQSEWHTGFLRIACGAGVPIQLGVIDFKRKMVLIKKEYRPTCDIQTDMNAVKDFYADYMDAALYPEKFTV